jgi:hypothetical protein
LLGYGEIMHLLFFLFLLRFTIQNLISPGSYRASPGSDIQSWSRSAIRSVELSKPMLNRMIPSPNQVWIERF